MTNQEFLKRLGMEFKVARIRKGMTRTELSKITGLSEVSFAAIEGGKTDSKILTYKRVADALGVQVKDFL